MRSARHVDTRHTLYHTHVYTQASPEQHRRWHHCQMRSGCCELTQSPQPLTQYGAHDNRQAVISCWQFLGEMTFEHACMHSGMSRVSQRCPQRWRCLAYAWMATLYGMDTSIWPENSVNLAHRPPCTASRCGSGGREAFQFRPREAVCQSHSLCMNRLVFERPFSQFGSNSLRAQGCTHCSA
jgi:hypothetical protein